MTDSTLTTDRLTLRPATAEDAEAVWRLRTIPQVSRWIPISDATPLETFVPRFRDRLPHVLVIEREGELIGELLFHVHSAYGQLEVSDQAVDTVAEIGWGIHPDHQRQGYAREAVSRLLRHAFEERGLRRVTAEAFADNEATAGLCAALGFRLEGRFVRAALHRSEGWLDAVTYAMLAEEWVGYS
jgi:RimJ/RimL family protein N-acetyltransferase